MYNTAGWLCLSILDHCLLRNVGPALLRGVKVARSQEVRCGGPQPPGPPSASLQRRGRQAHTQLTVPGRVARSPSPTAPKTLRSSGSASLSSPRSVDGRGWDPSGKRTGLRVPGARGPQEGSEGPLSTGLCRPPAAAHLRPDSVDCPSFCSL